MSEGHSDIYLDKVRELHRLIGYPHEGRPSLSSETQRNLWVKLITEEVDELLAAIEGGDLEKTADGIADVLYVVFGAGLTFGLPISELFSEVHRSNMSKVSRGAVWRDDGKVQRGEDYTPPDVKRVLREALQRVADK